MSKVHYPRIVWVKHAFSANHALCITWFPGKLTVTPVRKDVTCLRCKRALARCAATKGRRT